jgi:hypothetical protein
LVVNFSTARGLKDLKLGYKVADIEAVQHEKFRLHLNKETTEPPNINPKISFVLNFIYR